jgi:phosphoglycerate kinase
VTTALPGIDTLGDLDGKRVLVRSDLNVPLEDGRITDDGRIRASLPTLRRLLDAGARVVVMAHLGRPSGTPDPRYSLRPVAARLGELLGRQVEFATDLAAVPPDAPVVLLENVRFDPGETAKDAAARAAFATRLAALGDVYVDDAFGAVHRAHASVDEIAAELPHAAGDLVLRELEVLQRLTEDPQRPFSADPRSRTSWRSSSTCCRASTVSWSAAACASRFSPRSATTSARHCSRPTGSRRAVGSSKPAR